MSSLAFELTAFVIGLLFGSFLNVCISRLPEHRSIAQPRSRCPHCGHTIRWYDNVPLASWLLLRARCRDCVTTIAWRYPAVELSMGLWCAVALALLLGALPGLHLPEPRLLNAGDRALSYLFESVAFVILGFLLIGLLVMDWQTHLLPDAFTLTGTVAGFLLLCTQAAFLPLGAGDIHLTPRRNLRLSSPGSFAAHGNVFLTGPEHLVFGRLLAIISAALILLLVRALYKAVRHREGLGLGDVKLLAMIAAFLGFWPAVLALFLGVIIAAAYAVLLLSRRRAGPATQLPFGSFLCIGGLTAALAGGPLIAWYRSLL